MDNKEFKEKIIPLQSAMQLLAERMLGDVNDAEDIVQDVFMSIWERRNDLDGHPNPQGYCIQMVRNRCIDLLRKRKRHDEHAESIRLMTDEAVMMEVEETQEKSRILRRLLGELPDRQRRAIEMKYIEECDTEKMMNALGMSSSNVYTTISRALQTLREKLKNEGGS